jgi:hypothetical protein
MVVTNVRVLWYSDIDERFNVSIPYNQVVRTSHLSVVCMRRARNSYLVHAHPRR